MRTLITLLASAALVSGATAFARGQQATFRGGVDLVGFGVTVVDRRGEVITDLTSNDFRIVEEGRPQTITSFARGDEASAELPLHLGLLFDTSGSMGEDIDLARSAAVKFLNTFTEAVDMTLVDFDTEVRVVTYSQTQFPRMVERIRTRKPQGWTAMYDALGVYLDGAAGNVGRTVLVLFTDGGDTRSSLGFSAVMDLVRASQATIHTVGFLEHQPGSARTVQRSRLSQIATATGGQAFFPLSMKDVEAAYDKVADQIRAQYTLGYVSTNAARDGRWRDVEVSLTRPDLRGARLQSRKGYFALYAEGQ